MTKQLAIGIAALALCLVLMGCGGDGGGEPTVAQTLYDELQTELDAALAELRETEGERDTANASVRRLNTELATARANVTQLEGVIGGMDDEADAAANASLHAQLNHANAEVMRLTGMIGAATDQASDADGASLHAQLSYAKAAAAKATAAAATAATTAQAEVTRLTTELATANRNLQAALSTQGTATTRLASLQTQLTAANAEVTRLRAEVTRLTGTTTPTDTTGTPTPTTTPTTQTVEATERAKGLEAQFPETAAAPVITATSPVTIEVMTKSRLMAKRGGYRAATNSTPRGLRTVGPLSLLPAGGQTGKTVVYTDRELTRPVSEHFALHKDPDAAQYNIVSGAAGLVTLGTTDVTKTAGMAVTHTLLSALAANAGIDSDGNVVTVTPTENTGATVDNRMLTKMAASFGGSVHGVPGTFRCIGTGCMISVTGTYHNNVAGTSPTKNRLNTVTMAAAQSDGTALTSLYFRPNAPTPSFSLCEDSVVCTAGDDEQYMTFGYWYEQPQAVGGLYDFDTFAYVEGTGVLIGSAAGPATGTVTYRGTAAGMYVEHDRRTAIPAVRQGEFTAVAVLTANFRADELSGNISSFTTTPVGGSSAPITSGWSITLDSDGTLDIDTLPGDTAAGGWTHSFVPVRDTAETLSPAVTGRFDASVANTLRIVGAYGAEAPQ